MFVENTHLSFELLSKFNLKIWLVLSQGITICQCRCIFIINYDIEVKSCSAGP